MANPSALFTRMNQLLAEVGASAGHNKVAEVSRAEPEGNGAGADSSSPSTKAEDNLTDVSTGERAREMSAGVKDYGAGSIDAAPDAKPGASQETRHAEIGIKHTGIGKDPSQENNYVGNLKEPGVGTSTDAKFDDGQKYASAAEYMKAAADERKAYFTKLANSILADIVAGATEVATQKQAGAANPPQASAPAETKVAAEDKPANSTELVDSLVKEAEAGYQLAALLNMEKLSSAERAQITFEQTIRDAAMDADFLAAYMLKAAEETESVEDPSEHGTSSADSTEKDDEKKSVPDHGSSPENGGAPKSEPSPDTGVPSEAAIDGALSSLGGGEAGAGGDMGGMLPPGGGMPPAGGEMPGGGMMGGDMGGAPGAGPMGAPPSNDETLQQLLMVLQELGIQPEQLAQLAGGQGQKLAAAAKAFQRSGKFEFKVATTDRDRTIRNRIKNTVLEMLG